MDKKVDYRKKIKATPVKRRPKIILHGVEGVGKTLAASRAPKPIIICAENGLTGPEFENTPNYTPDSWNDVLGFIEWLSFNNHEYETVVIDTADWLEAMLFEHICFKYGKESMADFDYGAGHVEAKSAWLSLLMRMERLQAEKDIIIIFTCHSEMLVRPGSTGEYEQWQMRLYKENRHKLREWSDCLLFCQFEVFLYKENGKVKSRGGDIRKCYTRHTSNWNAKNRYSLPESMPLDMPLILNAIENGNPENIQAVIDEITEISNLIHEQEKTKEVLEFIEKHKDNQVVLNELLNKMRVQAEKEKINE